MITTKSGTPLHGDWRRRIGTKTDAHLYAGSGHHPFDQRPMCGKAIRHMATVAVQSGVPCSDCLVQAITRRGDAK